MFMPNEVVFASWPFQQVEEIYACTHTILIHVYSFIYTYAYVCMYTHLHRHMYIHAKIPILEMIDLN